MSRDRIEVLVRSNGLGTAGFVTSLVGLFFCCGLLSPIGLLLSVVALIQPPRGMAFAGTLLGAIGSWWLFAFGLGFLAMVGLPVGKAAMDAQEKARSPNVVVAPAEPDPLPSEAAAATTTDPRREDSAPASSPAPGEAPPQPTVVVPPVEVPAAEEPAPAPAPNPKRRTWTSSAGQFSVEADFVSFGAGAVKLKKLDGSEISVPLERLSEADQKWIRDYMRGK